MVEVHEIVAVPEPVTLLGVILPQVSPAGPVSVRLTSPPNWFSDAIVTVVMAELPVLAGPGEVATIVKSRYWNRAVAVWTRDPLVPVRVRV